MTLKSREYIRANNVCFGVLFRSRNVGNKDVIKLFDARLSDVYTEKI